MAPKGAKYEIKVNVSFMYEGTYRNEIRSYYYRTYESAIKSYNAKKDFLTSEFKKAGISCEVNVELYRLIREPMQNSFTSMQ